MGTSHEIIRNINQYLYHRSAPARRAVRKGQFIHFSCQSANGLCKGLRRAPRTRSSWLIDAFTRSSLTCLKDMAVLIHQNLNIPALRERLLS